MRWVVVKLALFPGLEPQAEFKVNFRDIQGVSFGKGLHRDLPASADNNLSRGLNSGTESRDSTCR